MDKQLTNPDEPDVERDNEYMIYNIKYYFKNKIIISGLSVSQYNNWYNNNPVYSYSFILSRKIHSYNTGLTYFPYIEYERYKKEIVYFNPNYTYIGCIIRDDDLFVEPFIRFSNDNSNEKFTGIKLGIEI